MFGVLLDLTENVKHIDPRCSGKAVLTHSVNREPNTPEPGGVGATCRKNWTQVLFSSTLPPWMSRPFSPFHAWVTLPSASGSPFIQTLRDEHMCPGATSTLSLTFCAPHIVWDKQTRNSGRELFGLKGRESRVVGYFRVSGLRLHPVQLYIQLLWS